MQPFKGLDDTVHASQSIFRQILLAISEPGTVVNLTHDTSWENLSAASTAVLLTLCDTNTSVYFSPTLHHETLLQSVQFHTQAKISDAQSAQFAFVSQADPFDAAAFNEGNEIFPEQSATVVVQVDSLTGGVPLSLSGAGIQTTNNVSPTIPDTLLTYYQTQYKRYPLGIDTLLTSNNQLMAIPRSTHVTPAQSNQEAG